MKEYKKTQTKTKPTSPKTRSIRVFNATSRIRYKTGGGEKKRLTTTKKTRTPKPYLHNPNPQPPSKKNTQTSKQIVTLTHQVDDLEVVVLRRKLVDLGLEHDVRRRLVREEQGDLRLV